MEPHWVVACLLSLCEVTCSSLCTTKRTRHFKVCLEPVVQAILETKEGAGGGIHSSIP